MPKYIQKKKNQFLHVYPIISPQYLITTKTTYTKCESHIVYLEKPHFPKRSIFTGKQKRIRKANIHHIEEEKLPHIRVSKYQFHHKEIINLHETL